jgi:sortase A
MKVFMKNKIEQLVNKLRQFFVSNKRKVIRYSGIALIVIGVAILIWPLYTNFIMARRERAVLSAWDENIMLTLDTSPGEKEGEGDEGKIQDNPEANLEIKVIDPEKKLPFKISIPATDLEWLVMEGTDYATLKKGPGHYTGSALPGENGTCVIAGHRTTYGAPFNRLDELKKGDEIILETAGNEKFTYIVTGQEAVIPTDLSVLENTDYPSLVLSTCTPKFYSTRRLIIYARMFE